LDVITVHEAYTEELHLELASLRAKLGITGAAASSSVTQSDSSQKDNRANNGVHPDPNEVPPQSPTAVPSKHNESMLPIPTFTTGTETLIIVEETPIEGEVEKTSRPSKKKSSKKSKKTADDVDKDEEKRAKKEEKAKRREERKASKAKAQKENPPDDEADRGSQRGVLATEAPDSNAVKNVSSLGNAPGNPSSLPSPTNTAGTLRSSDPIEPGDGPTKAGPTVPAPTDSPIVTTPSKSALKKRYHQEAGLDSPAVDVKKKKVRIRLPSPFLQPDTDEGDEESDANTEKTSISLQTHEDLDEAWDDIMVTMAPSAAAGEPLEVENAIISPIPASLLEKYQASKSIFQQTQNNFDNRAYPGFVSQLTSNEWHVPQLGPSFPTVNAEKSKLPTTFISPVILTSK